jgi:hypothetical protein
MVRAKKGEQQDEEEKGATEDDMEEEQESECLEHDLTIIERLGISFDTFKSFQATTT